MEVSLHADTGREKGSRASRRIRREGKVPAVVYGRGAEPIVVAVDAHDLYRVLHTEAGVNAIINLQLDGGEAYPTLVREIKRHPWRGTIDHVDFLRVSLTETVMAEVTITFVGTPVGVATAEGIVETIKHAVQVEALPGDIPSTIPLDISALAIGEGARVSDLPRMAGVAYLDDPDTLLVTVTTPAVEVVVEEVEEEEEGVVAEGVEAEPAPEKPKGEASSE